MLRGDGKPVRALVINANSHMRRLIKTLLSALPVDHCVEARCSNAAIPLTREHDPDLIVLDMSRDPTSALLFAHRVRSGDLGRADTPILALNPSSHHAVLEEAWRAGIDDVAQHPLSAMDLLRQAAGLMARRAAAAPAAP